MSQAKIILALDLPDADAALAMARRVRGHIGLVKVGLELFISAGPEVVRRLRGEGFGVFLDLKLHDIPNTVASAVTAAGRLEAQMLTVHTGGGPKMMAAAAAAARQCEHPPLLLGVTVLTSLDQAELRAIGIAGTPAERALAWAREGQASGLGGLVCSAHEAAKLRRACPGMVLVTPGIRPAGAAVQDQARAATPGEALRQGAHYLVVGRPVTAAADPVAALEAIAGEMAAETAREMAPCE